MQTPLPPAWYTDPRMFHLELDQLFGHTWLPACHGNEIPEPGSYTALRVGGQEIVVVRGRDGTVRAFHNVCQHRAHRLLDGCGTLKSTITCPYHAWAYGLDGALRNARNATNVAGFDRSEFGLSALAVADLAGFVMVNHDTRSVPPEGFCGLEELLLREFPRLSEMRPVRRREVVLNANWKTIIENYLECYHCDTAHPSFGSFDMTTYKHIVGQGWTRQGRVAPGTPDEEVDHSAIVGQSNWWQWPGIFWAPLHFTNESFVATFHEPLAVDRTLQVCVIYALDDEDSDELRRFNDFLELVFEEDTSLVESVQRGLGNRGYRGGALMGQSEARAAWSEHGLVHFQGLMRGVLGSPTAAFPAG